MDPWAAASLGGGVASAAAGAVLWWRQERARGLVNGWVLASAALVVAGAVGIVAGHERIFAGLGSAADALRRPPPAATAREWLFVVGLIFAGSVAYTVAAYYHLRLRNWSFLAAFALALPLILVEYQFSIRGNHAAAAVLGLNAVQITLLTMSFYFVNSWALNHFVLRRPVVWWREALAFACVACAVLLSTQRAA